jgi:hypothetical protein
LVDRAKWQKPSIKLVSYKCWDINGTDLDPTPQIPDGTPAATTAQLSSKIDSWEHRRNLAQEAIFKYLSSNDIAKSMKSRHEIQAI